MKAARVSSEQETRQILGCALLQGKGCDFETIREERLCVTEGEVLAEGEAVVWGTGSNVCAGILPPNITNISFPSKYCRLWCVRGELETWSTTTSSKRRLTGVKGPRAPNEVSDSNDTSISSVGEGEPERFSAGTESSDTSILGERDAIPWLDGEFRLTSKVAALASAVILGDPQGDDAELPAASLCVGIGSRG